MNDHPPKVRLEEPSQEPGRHDVEGWSIRGGFAATPFGIALLAEGPQGICHLGFHEPGEMKRAWEGLLMAWPRVSAIRDDERAIALSAGIFRREGPEAAAPALRVFVRGTAFQIKVWRALLQIPEGEVRAYGKVAEAIGNPKAHRATGTAIGKNPVAWLIPCHRVIRRDGVLGGYRWGPERKRAMLEWEKANHRRSLTS